MANRPGTSGPNLFPEVMTAITDLIGSEEGFANFIEVVRTNPAIQTDVVGALRTVADRRIAADLRVISVSNLFLRFLANLLVNLF